MSAAAPSQAPPLRRDMEHRVLAGVCAGLEQRFGTRAAVWRVLFAVTSVFGGLGLAAYVVAAVAIPASGDPRARPVFGGPGAWHVAAGFICLALAGMLVMRQLGWWIGDGFAWPLVLAAGGGALIWHQSQSAAVREVGVERPWAALTRPYGELARKAGGRALLGAALVIGAALAFLWLNDALAPARDVLLAIVVLLIAITLILAPWWVNLVRSLTAERAERIRSEERAEVAAHLHDSVLQTLALVQKRAGDPRTVAHLARRQERELRAWLDGRPGPRAVADATTLAGALQAAAAEVEDAHGVAIDAVTVGDAALDERSRAVVAAAREAMVNAAKFAGGAPIALYAEATPDRVEVFVRDRGPGFDPAAVPEDRRGVRESIVGRLRRHGGRATVHAAPGAGTEVELVLERAP